MSSIRLNELRQKRQRDEQELLEPDKLTDRGFENQAEAMLKNSDIRRACVNLSDKDFVLITKIHCYEYTYREFADELGTPIGTILARVSRAKATIRRAIE